MFDPILSIWILIWTTLTSYGLYLLKSENKQASTFYVYGKSLDVTKKKGLFWSLFLVPKCWFVHFYLTAITVFAASLVAVLNYYQGHDNPALALVQLLSKYVVMETCEDITHVTSRLFTIILMLIQSSRRLFESLYISVFSDESKINILHYLFGHAFYILTAVSTLAPILFSDTSNRFTLHDILANLVDRRRAIGFVLFVYFSHQQHKCLVILANLRKDKTGKVITKKHYAPSGGLFEFVSCPHFLFEILLYMSIISVQNFESNYWKLIFILVASTQTINALIEQRYYKNKYKDYPKERKAIFPRLL